MTAKQNFGNIMQTNFSSNKSASIFLALFSHLFTIPECDDVSKETWCCFHCYFGSMSSTFRRSDRSKFIRDYFKHFNQRLSDVSFLPSVAPTKPEFSQGNSFRRSGNAVRVNEQLNQLQSSSIASTLLIKFVIIRNTLRCMTKQRTVKSNLLQTDKQRESFRCLGFRKLRNDSRQICSSGTGFHISFIRRRTFLLLLGFIEQ